MVNGLGRDWLRIGMPAERMELWARRFEIKEGLWCSGSRAVFSPEDAWASCCSCLRLPTDGNWCVFWMGEETGRSLRSGWPGRGWQGYSLAVLEGDRFCGRCLPFFQHSVAFLSYVLVCKLITLWK